MHSQIHTKINAGLTTVPSDIPANTVEVNPRQNDIEDITVDPFTQLIAIQLLGLSLNRLTVMPAVESTSSTLENSILMEINPSQVPADYFIDFTLTTQMLLLHSVMSCLENSAFILFRGQSKFLVTGNERIADLII